MYAGPVTKHVTIHRDKYLVGIGTVPSVSHVEMQTWHQYVCERCHMQTTIPQQAEQPFYCRACGVHEIGIR